MNPVDVLPAASDLPFNTPALLKVGTANSPPQSFFKYFFL